MNRKGIIFSLITALLFTSIILAGVSINSRVTSENTMISQEIHARISRNAYETVSNNIAKAFGTQASNHTINLTINEEMPKNISKAVNDYETFLNNVFIKQSPIIINITSKEEKIYIGNHSIINYGINKSWFNLTSNQTIIFYFININASAIQNIVASNWVWTTNGTRINLTIKDASGTLAVINGSRTGYINTSRLNTFNITYNNGKTITVSVKDYLLLNTTQNINTSVTTNLQGETYTGHYLKINNTIIELTKNYRTIIK